jgi:hypothetical protein
LGLDILSNYIFTFDFDKGAVSVDAAKNTVVSLHRNENQEISDMTFPVPAL